LLQHPEREPGGERAPVEPTRPAGGEQPADRLDHPIGEDIGRSQPPGVTKPSEPAGHHPHHQRREDDVVGGDNEKRQRRSRAARERRSGPEQRARQPVEERQQDHARGRDTPHQPPPRVPRGSAGTAPTSGPPSQLRSDNRTTPAAATPTTSHHPACTGLPPARTRRRSTGRISGSLAARRARPSAPNGDTRWVRTSHEASAAMRLTANTPMTA